MFGLDAERRRESPPVNYKTIENENLYAAEPLLESSATDAMLRMTRVGSVCLTFVII
jgi:hypothetical protein